MSSIQATISVLVASMKSAVMAISTLSTTIWYSLREEERLTHRILMYCSIWASSIHQSKYSQGKCQGTCLDMDLPDTYPENGRNCRANWFTYPHNGSDAPEHRIIQSKEWEQNSFLLPLFTLDHPYLLVTMVGSGIAKLCHLPGLPSCQASRIQSITPPRSLPARLV